MRFLFVTYRWGEDLVGGAEIHHRRLAQELLDEGHQVEVLTTTGHEVRPFCHWGVEWTEKKSPGREGGAVPVQRVRLKKRSRPGLALDAKLLQWKMEKEERFIPPVVLDTLAGAWTAEHGVHLLSGWHHPEMHEGKAIRWTQAIARLAVRTPKAENIRLVVKGHAPHTDTVTFRTRGIELSSEAIGPGWFETSTPVAPEFDGRIYMELAHVFRPVRDFRALGLHVHTVELHADGFPVMEADMTADFRALGRARPEQWQNFLLDRAQRRNPVAGRLMNHLRGPESRGLQKALKKTDADHVIHCNLPWANVSLIRPGDLAMPIWHVDDEFYYWRHWIKALRRARFVLANTPYTAEHFFPRLEIKGHFVGPPIWEPQATFSPEEVSRFREKHGIGADEIMVLTVCRKSPEKRYEAVAASVVRLRARGFPIRMMGVGPEGDGRPFEYDGAQWVGKLTGDDLQCAYAASDVFCLMSESESFGMVIPEAWHHGKPVVVNRLCRPAASLVDEGVDGLLAAPGGELDAALEVLAHDREKRRALGTAGKEKARENYVRGSSARRLLKALEKERP